ncbi:transmembrane 7 superfamily member 3 [Papilio machaon]|uniref:transmembrane 7 superfamily member 3 n=1 Tax=Papilio machaon TaxID=76193 RepID=UPI001E664A55|nr:transmembrane 7 superfamily member 3 [Papilio machaon]
MALTIPLNKTTSLSNKEIFGQFVNLNASSTLQVGFVNVTKSISFIIFQVHSHHYNVTVYNNTLTRSSSVYGTNIGMYSSVKPPLDKFYISNQNAVDIKLYIVVHGYASTDPVPGGCNMEFQPSISPYLHTSYTNDYVLVEAASARDSSDIACTSINDVNVVFYLMYLEERNFDSDTYFEGIKSMLTLDNITDNAEIVPQTTWRMRRMLGAYPGTGAIFVAVAYSALNSSAYSVYVPTYSYACSPLDESCELLDDVLSQLLCASLLFFGMFVCYFGHRFFKTEMFLIGLVSGVIITYILISLIAELERPALLGAAILSGTCFGFIWLLFWWFYGIPVFAVLLSTLNLGFLFAALMYFGLPGGFQALQVDFNFWTLFILIMSITSLILLSTTFLSNILCCAILGGYATVYPIDYYIGSNLKYIIINTVRRAVVPKFNSAVLSPPFQWADTLITILWLSLATTGFLFQHYQNRRKPPFPPPPRSIRPSVPDTTYGTTGRRYRDILQRPATSERRQTEYTPLLS